MGALFLLLAVLLPRDFFREYGALTGPIAWTACALATGRILGLPIVRVVVGAAGAGGLAALVGAAVGHLPALVTAVAAFAAACAVRRRPPEEQRISAEPGRTGRPPAAAATPPSRAARRARP